MSGYAEPAGMKPVFLVDLKFLLPAGESPLDDLTMLKNVMEGIEETVREIADLKYLVKEIRWSDD